MNDLELTTEQARTVAMLAERHEGMVLRLYPGRVIGVYVALAGPLYLVDEAGVIETGVAA